MIKITFIYREWRMIIITYKGFYLHPNPFKESQQSEFSHLFPINLIVTLWCVLHHFFISIFFTLWEENVACIVHVFLGKGSPKIWLTSPLYIEEDEKMRGIT